MSTKKKSNGKRAMPFIALFGDDGGERNARLALRDPKTSANLRAALERYLQNPARAAATDHQKLMDDAAPFQSGRQTGEDRDEEKQRRTDIRKLGNKHPTLSARSLYQHPGAKELKAALSLARFGNILSEEAPRRKKRSE